MYLVVHFGDNQIVTSNLQRAKFVVKSSLQCFCLFSLHIILSLFFFACHIPLFSPTFASFLLAPNV